MFCLEFPDFVASLNISYEHYPAQFSGVFALREIVPPGIALLLL